MFSSDQHQQHKQVQQQQQQPENDKAEGDYCELQTTSSDSLAYTQLQNIDHKLYENAP